MNSPLVSVIIPNYNHALFLKERIDSVLNQSYENFEVIILDDKSTDNSKEIIERYRNHHKISNIVYNDINSGSTFKQWNKGFSLAKGEWIWIAESDDVAHPDFLKKIMCGIARDNKIVIGYSALNLIDGNSNLICEKPLLIYQTQDIITGSKFIKHNMLFGPAISNASCAVFLKSTLISVPLDYTSYKGAGDYLFWLEISRQGKIFYCNESLDYFRQHSVKVTPGTVKSGIQFFETFKIFCRLEQLGYLNAIDRINIIGFRLYLIDKEKNTFNSKEIYTNCKNLWKNETRYPSLAKLSYLVNGLFRFIKKRYFNTIIKTIKSCLQNL